MCDITTEFEDWRSPNGRIMLRECVQRELRCFETASHPAWIAQAALRDVVLALYVEWRVCVRMRLDAAGWDSWT